MIVLRNMDVKRIIAGIPRGHKHLRLVLESTSGIIVLHEATVAAIVRSYINIVAHPVRRGLELVGTIPDNIKPGYAEHQLLESNRSEREILEELETILNEAYHRQS